MPFFTHELLELLIRRPEEKKISISLYQAADENQSSKDAHYSYGEENMVKWVFLSVVNYCIF